MGIASLNPSYALVIARSAATKQSMSHYAEPWIASRSLSSGAHSRDPLARNPVSLFAQYQHTWWDNANFNRPTSSPAFNYAFRREDDTIKLGVNFYFGAAPAPASRAYPVKALPLR